MSSLPEKNKLVRGALLSSILELDKLYEVELNNAKANKLLDASAKLHDLLVTAMKHQLVGTSDDFVEALISLNTLTTDCKQAQQDLEKVVLVINKVSNTIDKVTKVVSKAATLLA